MRVDISIRAVLLSLISLGAMLEQESASFPSSTSAVNMSTFASDTSAFVVHVFIRHNPYNAFFFLPSLFSNFPDSAWRLPEIKAPSKPDSWTRYLEARDILGRHVFAEPLPGTTTLRELSQGIEKQFGIRRELHAHFTIFPQKRRDEWYPPWHDEPLPQEMMIGEVKSLDVDAPSLPTQSELPIVHLVLETKATALTRMIVGGDSLQLALGKEYGQAGIIWTSAETINPLRFDDRPELFTELSIWRNAVYTLSYLENQRDKVLVQMHGDERESHDSIDRSSELRWNELEAQIARYQQRVVKAKTTISILAGYWTDWVLNEKYVESFNVNELPDEQVEARVQRIWRMKHALIKEWKQPEKKEILWKELEKDKYKRPQQGDSDNLRAHEEAEMEASETLKRKKEHEKLKISDQEASASELANSSCYGTCVETLPLRQADGTLRKDVSAFTVTSGVLLWGQVLEIYYGTLQDNFTNNAAGKPRMPASGYPRGTVHTYKSGARNGAWKVRRYYSNWNGIMEEEPETHVGWVVCHEDVDPLELVRRTRAPGYSYMDEDILLVGGRDWSRSWCESADCEIQSKFQAYAEPAIGPTTEEEWIMAKSNVISFGYLLAMDAEGWGLDFLSVYKQECDQRDFDFGSLSYKSSFETLFKRNGHVFGAYVRQTYTEHEIAELVFSGAKHATHDADELIGIVYSGSNQNLYYPGLYNAVEGDPGSPRYSELRQFTTDAVSPELTTQQ